jgi:hypothetical protein
MTQKKVITECLRLDVSEIAIEYKNDETKLLTNALVTW